jgi:hypothetical protein
MLAHLLATNSCSFTQEFLLARADSGVASRPEYQFKFDALAKIRQPRVLKNTKRVSLFVSQRRCAYISVIVVSTARVNHCPRVNDRAQLSIQV